MVEAWPDVAHLLPHQPPMRLIDRVTAWADDRIEVQVDTGPGAPFCRDGAGVPAWVGMEYLGQAAAAWFALAARAQMARAAGVTAPPGPGMLVACRRYETSHGYFPAPAVLTVTVRPGSLKGGPLVKFAGEIHRSERLAWGEVSVYMVRGAQRSATGPGAVP